MKFFALILCCATLVPAQEDSRQWLNKGVKAFKANDYAGAVDAFERAVALAPNEPAPHLYLASAYASRLMPDAQNPENQVLAAKVAREYQRVLEIEPRNKAALVGLANFSFQQKKFDQAKELSERILAIDPYEKETYYRLGVIAWSKAFPVRMEARSKVGMRPEEPGPLPPSVRFDVANQNRQIVLDGIRNLEKAIDIDPQYDDALAYINLLYRERADLADTREAYQSDVARADEYVQRTLAVKRAKNTGLQTRSFDMPQTATSPAASISSDRIRVDSEKDIKQISRATPVYPPLAKQARIQGKVRFDAIINKQGRIQQLTAVSGHRLLIPAAQEAVRQWVYEPTLWNGHPMEVQTTIDVTFSLTP